GVVAPEGVDEILVPRGGGAARAAVVDAAIGRAELRARGAVGVGAAVPRDAQPAAAKVGRVGGAGAARAAHGADTRSVGSAAGGVADGRRAVARVGLALRVRGASAAALGRGGAADEAGLGPRAVRAGPVAIAELADPLVADVARAVGRIGRALRVAGAATAGVGQGDAAELAGRALGRGPVAVAGQTPARDADRGAAVDGVGAARGVRRARLAGVRGGVTNLAARAVGRGATDAGGARAVQAEMPSAVAAQALHVGATGAAGVAVGVTDLAGGALIGRAAGARDAAPADAQVARAIVGDAARVVRAGDAGQGGGVTDPPAEAVGGRPTVAGDAGAAHADVVAAVAGDAVR